MWKVLLHSQIYLEEARANSLIQCRLAAVRDSDLVVHTKTLGVSGSMYLITVMPALARCHPSIHPYSPQIPPLMLPAPAPAPAPPAPPLAAPARFGFLK